MVSNRQRRGPEFRRSILVRRSIPQQCQSGCCRGRNKTIGSSNIRPSDKLLGSILRATLDANGEHTSHDPLTGQGYVSELS